MRARLFRCLLVGFALVGCGEPFDPPSLVNKLRLLAIRAEAPEIAPPVRGNDGLPVDPQPEGHAPDRTTLTSLVADPAQAADPGRRAMVVYIACTPRPGSLEPSICNLVETYTDPRELPRLLELGGGECRGTATPVEREFGEGVIGTVTFAGLEVCDHEEGCMPVETETVALPEPTYVLPREFDWSGVPEGHPHRVNGVQVVVVAIVVQASPEELLAGTLPHDPCAFAAGVAGNLGELLETRERLLALKRVQVRGPDVEAAVNVNPAIAGIVADGRVLPSVVTDPPQPQVQFGPGRAIELRPQLPIGSDGKPLTEEELYQSFMRYDADGRPIREEREAWVWSWFATAGTFERERTRSADQSVEWTAPSASERPGDGRVFLWAVVRDARGGIDWVRREVRIR